MVSVERVSALDKFLDALDSPSSRTTYAQKLRLFFDFHCITGSSLEERAERFVQLAKENGGVLWVRECIFSFIHYQKERLKQGKLRPGTVSARHHAIQLFCEMNEDEMGTESINWRKLRKVLPSARSYSDDRIPILDEIRHLVEYPDRRIKPLVYVMCSSGIRIGAWEHLRWKHVQPITNEKGDVIAAKLAVYDDEEGIEKYDTLMTPEAYNALRVYIDFRASFGEKITGESWLMRDKWETSNAKRGARLGLATNPKQLRTGGIRKVLIRALSTEGLRLGLPEGKRRYEWKVSHSFRKFFEAYASQVMLDKNVNKLMNHHVDFEPHYYRPLEQQQVIDDYLKAVPLLTINDNNNIEKSALQKQVTDLTQKAQVAEQTQTELGELKAELKEHRMLVESLMDRLVDIEMEKRSKSSRGGKSSRSDIEDDLEAQIEEENAIMADMLREAQEQQQEQQQPQPITKKEF